ncbi:ArsR/SmtB family transcription factor [Oryzihumus leptocrescens]|uniref:ArsR family transcriptional regulator n=1 Tax=Oryzihumus leptocrescens TaxID=297536 RepID=A0A542ZES7_9MICO|nr:metalloregulator ArsR/SmtB family transcription factor [Oryzihumus leptocrescens]TQL58811.1 ArsR family transcriptional regulator [Oryzihumus leptocrescens]
MPKPLPLLQDTSPICCAPLAPATRMSRDDAVGLAVRLKALADPARLLLVDHLLSQPDYEACTCDLAPVVGLSEPTTSHHLKQLLTAGLVTKRRDGMNVHYRLVPEAMNAVSRVLDTGCC